MYSNVVKTDWITRRYNTVTASPGMETKEEREIYFSLPWLRTPQMTDAVTPFSQ